MFFFLVCFCETSLATQKGNASAARTGKTVNARPHESRGTASAASFASVAGGGVEKPLQVRGQTRNLNMMLVIKNEKDRINFVDLRTNYKVEVSGTEY